MDGHASSPLQGESCPTDAAHQPSSAEIQLDAGLLAFACGNSQDYANPAPLVDAAIGNIDPGDTPLIHRDPFVPENDHGSGTWPNLPANLDATDPLYMLMIEFRQALMHPKTNGMTEVSMNRPDDSTLSIGFSDNEDAFPHPVSHFPPESAVTELLMARKNIDTLLDSLDSFDAASLFEADQRHDILSLLAPPDLRACRAGPVARLTREEHHMIGLDSHIALPNSIEAPTSESRDEHHC